MPCRESRIVSKGSRVFISRVALVAMLCAGLTIISTAPAAGQNRGPKRTEELVKRAEEVVKKTGEAEAQLRKTIDIYNSIMQGRSEDMKKSYENLQKEINNTQKKREDVRKRFDEMGQEADRVFASWHQEIEAIASPEVRDLSRNRMMETREKYNAIRMASNEAGGEVDTLFATLHDHVLFLGYDLNPTGVATLAEEAAKLNEQANKLLADIEAAMARVNEYIEATRAQ